MNADVFFAAPILPTPISGRTWVSNFNNLCTTPRQLPRSRVNPMDGSPSTFRVTPAKAILSVVYLLFQVTLPSAILAGIFNFSGLMNVLPVWAFITLAPAIYFTWLVLFMVSGYLTGIPLYAFVYTRQARFSTKGGAKEEAFYSAQMLLYLKAALLHSLPGVRSLQTIPYWQQLVFRSYAPKNKIGRHARVWGHLWDPDITEIGNDTIIGADTHITCHGVMVQPDGSHDYACAPVVIGRRVTIGGEGRIAMGTKIGDDAIVEPGSNILPFTIIPSAEVWGGNPARFIRPRFVDESQQQVTSMSTPEPATLTIASNVPATDSAANTVDELLDSVREVVATSLNMKIDDISSSSSMLDVADWDSLGQMSIAAGIHSRFGIPVNAGEMFRLRSVSDISRFVSNHHCQTSTSEVSDVSLPRDLNLLPLMNHEQATRALASSVDKLPKLDGSPLRIVVASTFTADSIGSSLKLWSQAFGINVEVQFSGFNQVAQELLSPESSFRSNRTGLNIILTRPEDLLGAERANSAEALLEAITAFSRDSRETLVVGTLPPVVSKIVRVDRNQAESLRAEWRQKLSHLSGVTLLDFAAAIEDVGVADATHTENEIVARSPYSDAVYREVGIAIARLVRQRRVAPSKVIAIDADGVLWGGAIAEEGMQGIQLGTDHPGRSFRLFQQYIKSLKDQGQLLVLVSRNQAEDVWKVLDEHPEMVLRRDDFAGSRINWRPKSENVKELAQELNLGLDSFVFIDDDAVNRLEMEANAPQVTVIPLPIDAAQYVPVVSSLWRFDAPRMTDEDRSRTMMMQQEKERQELQDNTGDLQTYLRSLSLKVTMRPAGELDMPRVAQLTQKTNQFNLSLKRRSVSELVELGERFSIQVIEASDRFGDYGLVGVSILERPVDANKPFILDTMLMSCRVLSRGVEIATLHGLANLILANQGRSLEAPFAAGPRNQPILDFLKQAGFQTSDGIRFLLNVSSGVNLPEHIQWSGPNEPQFSIGKSTKDRFDGAVAA